jgi:ATP-binding cassette subfamily C protein LapB
MAQVANLAVNYHRASTALKSLDTIMDLPVEREKDKQYVRRRKLHGNINFQNVDFTYPGQQTQALSGVSFAVKQGQHVAIIGRIGTGKSTIEKMIMGLYEPEKGAVRIDGIDTRQIDPIDLRRNIGYVPQDAVLFYGTVRDNITYGATSVSDDLLLRAAQTVGIHEFIDRHPLGYDMQVGEGGEGLSGGQRKGIAIARALLLDPPILLMDEPSNSMDNTSEKIFRENLKKYAEGKTLFIITHRLSMMELVDRILVIDNGRIVADGPKEDVLEMLKKGKIRTIKP